MPSIKEISPLKIFIALLISISASVWLLKQNFNPEILNKISFDSGFLGGLALCFFLVLVRDGMYVIRLHLLTSKKLNWVKSLQVILLWEFGSAFTYGAVGGKALMLYVFKKEHLGYGRAVFTIMSSAFLDNLVFLLMFGGLYAVLGNSIFDLRASCSDIDNSVLLSGLRSLADKMWIGFGAIGLLVLFLSYLLFINTKAVHDIAKILSAIPLLKNWSLGWHTMAADISLSSQEIRKQKTGDWIVLIVVSALSWLSRFALANAVIFTIQQSAGNFLEILSRQFLLWFYIITPTTPGSSGTAEAGFMALNCDFLPVGYVALAAVIWRLFSFYLYIFLGIGIFSFWMGRKE